VAKRRLTCAQKSMRIGLLQTPVLDLSEDLDNKHMRHMF
jgi:hypothetical protein